MQDHPLAKKIAAFSGILVFFIMAFEVMIMISPFAFFFYSVFSPLFNFLGQHAATRWLTMFFLPHMILPPTTFLKAVRVSGSILFVVGFLGFTICALQVYLGKIFKWGIASKGLYQKIRHPQYLLLGIWGLGMAILWPRFIVLATLSLMFILYYFLAKDEERRMLSQYGDSYREYMAATGMFFPKGLEQSWRKLTQPLTPFSSFKYLAVPVMIVVLVMGSGFTLRKLTLSSLPFATEKNLVVVPILPEDSSLNPAVLKGILSGAATGQIPFLHTDKVYLGYVMPPDYIMQGMIADTGGHFHLFKKHHTFALITDWVFHPFEHLRRSPMAQMAAEHQIDPAAARRRHCPVGINTADLHCDTCSYRRVILLEVEPVSALHIAGEKLLAGNTTRTPVGFIDLDTTTGKVIKATKVAKGSAWKDVPTPEI
jgi:protein-S-isoprenylcysteine O-methyltransferase Ste14